MFLFDNEYILEDNRVKLTPLQVEHHDLLLPFSEQEPELWQYSLQSGAGKENLSTYIQYALQQRSKAHSYPFLIYDKDKAQVAGSSRFYDYQEHHNTIQLGYTWMGKHFQGTGLNKHCKNLMLNFAFDTIKVDRVEFRADANNEKSISAMKGIGCVVEGILRSNCSAPDGRRDSIVLSILKKEWESSKREYLHSRCYPK